MSLNYAEKESLRMCFDELCTAIMSAADPHVDCRDEMWAALQRAGDHLDFVVEITTEDREAQRRDLAELQGEEDSP